MELASQSFRCASTIGLRQTSQQAETLMAFTCTASLRKMPSACASPFCICIRRTWVDATSTGIPTCPSKALYSMEMWQHSSVQYYSTIFLRLAFTYTVVLVHDAYSTCPHTCDHYYAVHSWFLIVFIWHTVTMVFSRCQVYKHSIHTFSTHLTYHFKMWGMWK